ncbi:MAG: nickel-dependent lactate racemase [Chloroflexi bacterium]|nr:nickel-dependent lactate racemase [Chloroflexota bacterium]
MLGPDQTLYRLPYGQGEIAFRLPPGMRGHLAISRVLPPLPDVAAAARQAVAQPVASLRLREMARPGQRVCIVFTDITRASPDHLLVPPVLAELHAAGVADDDITLLCGIGLHRPSTPDEKVAKLGQAIVDRYRVVDSEPLNSAALVDLGATPSGVPMSVHRCAYEADLLIATGIVEPHQYAGYSGGRKTVAIGAAGEPMISYTHGPALLDHPGTRLGRIEGNPFHEAISEAARRAGLRFIVNAVLDDDKRVVALKAGAPEAAFADLVQTARALFETPIPRQFHVAIGGVGFPKDANLYQASRAASYLYFAPTPVVRPGGFLIVPAPCQEGPGEGVGERRFFQALQEAPTPQAIIQRVQREGLRGGEQRAYIMARVLEGAEVVVVGAQDPQMIREAKMTPVSTVDEALALAAAKLGRELDVLVVPHALLTLPIVQAECDFAV